MFPGRDKSGFVGPGLVADWQPRSLFDNAGWHPGGGAPGGAPGGAAARRVLRRVLVAGAAANAAWGFEALGDVVSPVAVWKSTSGTPRPAKTSNLSISITSIRLILGRIDGSRRVLEAQLKNVRRNHTLTLESGRRFDVRAGSSATAAPTASSTS